jgi:hypothetical protein
MADFRVEDVIEQGMTLGPGEEGEPEFGAPRAARDHRRNIGKSSSKPSPLVSMTYLLDTPSNIVATDVEFIHVPSGRTFNFHSFVLQAMVVAIPELGSVAHIHNVSHLVELLRIVDCPPQVLQQGVECFYGDILFLKHLQFEKPENIVRHLCCLVVLNALGCTRLQTLQNTFNLSSQYARTFGTPCLERLLDVCLQCDRSYPGQFLLGVFGRLLPNCITQASPMSETDAISEDESDLLPDKFAYESWIDTLCKRSGVDASAVSYMICKSASKSFPIYGRIKSSNPEEYVRSIETGFGVALWDYARRSFLPIHGHSLLRSPDDANTADIIFRRTRADYASDDDEFDQDDEDDFIYHTPGRARKGQALKCRVPLPAPDYLIGITGADESTFLRVHGFILAQWQFFVRMVQSGMSEATTKRIELPDDFPPEMLRIVLAMLYGFDVEQMSRPGEEDVWRSATVGVRRYWLEHAGYYNLVGGATNDDKQASRFEDACSRFNQFCVDSLCNINCIQNLLAHNAGVVIDDRIDASFDIGDSYQDGVVQLFLANVPKPLLNAMARYFKSMPLIKKRSQIDDNSGEELDEDEYFVDVGSNDSNEMYDTDDEEPRRRRRREI